MDVETRIWKYHYEARNSSFEIIPLYILVNDRWQRWWLLKISIKARGQKQPKVDRGQIRLVRYYFRWGGIIGWQKWKLKCKSELVKTLHASKMVRISHFNSKPKLKRKWWLTDGNFQWSFWHVATKLDCGWPKLVGEKFAWRKREVGGVSTLSREEQGGSASATTLQASSGGDGWSEGHWWKAEVRWWPIGSRDSVVGGGKRAKWLSQVRRRRKMKEK